jgi:hypothetical protein
LLLKGRRREDHTALPTALSVSVPSQITPPHRPHFTPHNTTQHSTKQYNTPHHSTTHHNAKKHRTAPHSTTHHTTVQHVQLTTDTTKQNATQRFPPKSYGLKASNNSAGELSGSEHTVPGSASWGYALEAWRTPKSWRMAPYTSKGRIPRWTPNMWRTPS